MLQIRQTRICAYGSKRFHNRATDATSGAGAGAGAGDDGRSSLQL